MLHELQSFVLAELAEGPPHHVIRIGERLGLVRCLRLANRPLGPLKRVVRPAFVLKNHRVPGARSRGLPGCLGAGKPL